MDLIRYTHSCVRVERDDAVLVIDPGVWSEPRALSGADAILVTHEHMDHVDELRVASLDVPTYAPAEARFQLIDPIRVLPGETFEAAGFSITAEGGWHATVMPNQSPCPNLGYRLENFLYHPGDSLAHPTDTVDTLLVPLQASWLKTIEAVEFVKAVAPARAVGIHDAQLNERGLEALNYWLRNECGPRYMWSAPGHSVRRPTQ